ncbi:MAG: nitroreductase family deazaflavin-dependent oxidoreductase [Acidimicrobiales bacterium]
MRPARLIARFNRLVTNRVQGIWAPYLPPYAMVIHRGRKSGRTYRTPVAGIVRRRRLVVALPYGDDTDWVRNLLAADGGEVIRRGRKRRIAEPRVVTLADRRSLPLGTRWITRVTAHTFVARLERRR